MDFIRRNTIEQNADKLPQYLRDEYKSAPIDRFYIDGVEYSGFYDFSYIEEKTYLKEPERTNTGVIVNMSSYVSFLTPRFTVSYKMMNIGEYRRFINTIKSKNEFSITCYSIDDGKMVTNKMYVAPNSMPKVYTRMLQVLGIMDYSIEFIGTNADVETYTLLYNFGEIDGVNVGSEETQVVRNVSSQIGYTDGSRVELYGESLVEQTLEKDTSLYVFNGWLDENGFSYIDGDAYYITKNKAITAQWVSGGTASNPIEKTLTNCTSAVGIYKKGTSGFYKVKIIADEGYTLEGASVSVVYNETDVTSTAYTLQEDGIGYIYISGLDSDGKAEIDITITAVAV